MNKTNIKKPVAYFTDDMHKDIFVFKSGLNPKYTSKGGKIIDPISTRVGGAIKGGRKVSVR